MLASKFAQLVVIAGAFVGVFSFVSSARDSEARRLCTPLCALRPAYAAENRMAPDFELPSLNGDKVRLSSYRGKVVILNFWTKTCGPCLEEMPSIAKLAKMLGRESGIALVTITTDESASDARETLRSVLGGEAPFTVLVDAENAVVNGKFGTKLFPETWFVDENGVIRARFDGARDWSNPMVLDLAKTLKGPLHCGVSFAQGKPQGPVLNVCADTLVSGSG